MRLPYCKKAVVPLEKLTDYILSETHIVGKLKAKFFRKAGFNETNVSILKTSLLKIAFTETIEGTTKSNHGEKYVIDGKIQTPSKKIITVRTIWIIESGQTIPRFVTMYPV